MDTCSYYYYSTPQEYISKLQEMQSMGYTGGCPSTIGQCINQFQSAVPEFQNNLGALTLSFSSNPGSITKGQSSTLSWMAPKAVSCNASDGWNGNKIFGGSQTVSPNSSTKYTLNCSNACASVSKSTTVTVVNQPPVARFTMTSGSFSANENETLDLLGAPASVSFSASRSFDPDGNNELVAYEWKIDGQNAGMYRDFTPAGFTAGTHQISLTVGDQWGNHGSATAAVIITNAILNDPDCTDAYACYKGQSPLNLKWAVDAASSCSVVQLSGIYSKTVSSTGVIEGLVVPDGVHYYKLTCASDSGGKAERQIRITVGKGSAAWNCGDAIVYSGQGYGTVKIGSQCWLKDNLNVGNRIDGLANPTNNSIIEKYCSSNNDAKCATDGGLYQWNEMMGYSATEGAQGICPSGWHIPKDSELYALENHLSSNQCLQFRDGWDCDPAGTKLKTGGSSGFEAISTGFRRTNDMYNSLPAFENSVPASYFWSSTKYGDGAAYRFVTHYPAYSKVYRVQNGVKTDGLSVRCLKD